MITLFSTPKDFIGIFKNIQLNALRSWRALSPDIQIIILGDSEGSREAADEIQAEYIEDVQCSPRGVPILSDLFRKADKLAKYPILTFINADIILPDNFLSAIEISTNTFSKFLMVGHRWDMDVDTLINFNIKTEYNLFWERVKTDSNKHACTGIDYFVYKRNQWGKLPDFVIGRPGYDNWLIWKARRSLIPVVDASESVKVIHQNHYYNLKNTIKNPSLVQDYKSHPMLNSIEGKINKKLHKGRTLNLLDANYKIIDGEINKNISKEFIIRNLHRLPIIFPEFSIPIKIYRRLYKQYF